MDKITTMFFEHSRWQKAIDKGVGKDIRKDQLIFLTDERTRLEIAKRITQGEYRISPPHTAKIPKDNGDFRTVYINEPIDRIILSIANDLLFDLNPDMIHPRCKSYQTGIGCGKVVKEVRDNIVKSPAKEINIGWKSDLSKYFDSVPIQYIDTAFDKVETVHGKSPIIQILRDYYHSDLYFDEQGALQSSYQSLKQGCAVASWLANVILYDIDASLSNLNGYYVRYSDDMLFIGPDYIKAMSLLTSALSAMNMKLNPKKVEYLTRDKWFKFLGYSIKGSSISLSKTRIKTFQKEIEKRTIKHKNNTLKRAVNAVNRYLYKGDGKHSWATQILSVCNVSKDINELNNFVLDCIRAVQTGKRRIGGLGYVITQQDGCISRGKGRNVKANREKTEPTIDGYLSLACMQNALFSGRDVYNTLVSRL